MTTRRRPLFIDRRFAAAGLVTLAALIAVEAADATVTARHSDRVDDRGTGRLFAVAMSVAMGTAAGSLLRRQRRPLPRNRPLFNVGVALTWAGLALNRWARHELSVNYRPLITVVDNHHVVGTGPYRLVRHPMYLGATLICTGVAATLATPPTAAAWALPPAALVYRILIEERVLSDALGDAYRDFAANRARLVPKVW